MKASASVATTQNGETKYTTHHVCISVSGALRNFKPREWRNCVTDDDGNYVTPEVFREYLLQCQAEGKDVIPFGKPCEGFDYTGGGCPGHPCAPPAKNEPPPWAPPYLQKPT
jgi:hypothetical protein